MTAQTQKRILIVEDEKPMAKALALKLTHVGYDAVVTNNGQEGLAALEKEKFDLILLDIVMPKLDGFGVLEALKKNGNKTPVAMLSNLSQEEDEKKAKALGAREFFIKSNTPIADIVNRVQTILDQKSEII